MILEKIKENTGKVVFFVVNVLLATSGVLLLKIKNDQKTIETLSQPRPEEVAQAGNQCAIAAIEAVQQNISEDRKQKIESIADNPKETTIQKPVTVKTVVPGKTTTVKAPSKAKTKTS